MASLPLSDPKPLTGAVALAPNPSNVCWISSVCATWHCVHCSLLCRSSLEAVIFP